MRTSIVLACLPAVLLFLAQASHAETVAVVDLTASTTEHAEVASMRRKAVVAGHTVVADREMRASLVDGVAPSAGGENSEVATAREDMLEAGKLFSRLAINEANARLADAEEKILKQTSSEKPIALLADIELLRGQLAMAAGDETAGRKAFALSRLLAPKRTDLDPAEFPPAIRKSYSTAVATLSHRVRIASSPPGARVVLDGNDIGVTPLETIVSKGSHYLWIERADHESSAKRILFDGSSNKLAVTLVRKSREQRIRKRRRLLMEAGSNGDRVVVLCNELSVLAGVELLVLVREGETGVLVALFDRRTPSPLQWKTMLEIESQLAVSEPTPGVAAVSEAPKQRWYKKTWVVVAGTTLGVVATLVVAGVLVNDFSDPDAGKELVRVGGSWSIE